MPLGWPEIIAITLIIVLLFGAKKLPDAARSIGRSLRIFKSEMKEMSNDDAQTAIDSGAHGAQALPGSQPQVNQASATQPDPAETSDATPKTQQ